MVIFRGGEAARNPQDAPPARRSRARAGRLAASGTAVLGLLLSACGSSAGGEPEKMPGTAQPAEDDPADASDDSGGTEGPTDDAESDPASDAGPGSDTGTGTASGSESDSESDDSESESLGAGDSGSADPDAGDPDEGDDGDSGPHDPCDGSNTETTAEEVSSPVNHALLTVTNTGSGTCDLLDYPMLRFEDAQSVPPVYESSQPQSVVTLEPGESGYAGVSLEAADGSGGNDQTANTLEVFFHDRDGSSDASATPPLPEEGVSYDDSLTVTYWQHTRDDALVW